MEKVTKLRFLNGSIPVKFSLYITMNSLPYQNFKKLYILIMEVLKGIGSLQLAV